MQLQPTEQFTISRQLADPDDADTNFVQAVVRNAKTDAVLKTVELSNKGSQRFTGIYEIPGDVSGQGFYITITTLVYADSGYSTRNFNYNAEQNTYLVQDRPNRLTGGGSGGEDVDYKKIKAIVEGVHDSRDEKAAKITEKQAAKDAKKPAVVDPMPGAIKAIGQTLTVCAAALARLEARPKFEKADNAPVLEALKGLQDAVAALPDKFPKTELKDVQSAISDLTEAIGTSMETQDALNEDHRKLLSEDVAALKSDLEALSKDSPEPNYEPVMRDLEVQAGRDGIRKGIKRGQSKIKAIEENINPPEPAKPEPKQPPTAEIFNKPIPSPFNIKQK